MSTPYTVQRGDTLTKIAREHGFRSWRALYSHPDNAGFRRLRPNPDLIFPGDVIQIPDAPITGATHPGLTPAPAAVDPQVGMQCCVLATHTECSYKGTKSNYVCPSGYVKQHWVCTEGTRKIGCGECAQSPSTICWVGPFACSIWWSL